MKLIWVGRQIIGINVLRNERYQSTEINFMPLFCQQLLRFCTTGGTQGEDLQYDTFIHTLLGFIRTLSRWATWSRCASGAQGSAKRLQQCADRQSLTYLRPWRSLPREHRHLNQLNNFKNCQKGVSLHIIYFECCDSCHATGDRDATVCASDSDITLQSSDGMLFQVHRKNLEVHSEGFAGADAISSLATEEIVPLSEDSAVLDLLLQYMYRQPQPDLRNVRFSTLEALAEAAEKYQVYSATTVCNIFMRFVWRLLLKLNGA